VEPVFDQLLTSESETVAVTQFLLPPSFVPTVTTSSSPAVTPPVIETADEHALLPEQRVWVCSTVATLTMKLAVIVPVPPTVAVVLAALPLAKVFEPEVELQLENA